MHKKIEDAAKEYSNNNAEGIGLGHDDDAFKAGAEFALRKAIGLCDKIISHNTDFIKNYGNPISMSNFENAQKVNLVSHVVLSLKEELEQLLSSAGEK